MPRAAWDKPRILFELRRLHRAGRPLSYNALARTAQSLVSAAAYHFGSYRSAVEQAGVDYADVTRRPRWTKARIIGLIQDAARARQDLNWAAVSARRDELGKAAFATLQPRLFGRWDKALEAAGLDASRISQYRHWNKAAVIAELRERAAAGRPVNSGAVQSDNPAAHAAAVRYFGGFDAALRAARIEPDRVRRRQAWDKSKVIRDLRAVGVGGSALRRDHSALYSAAVRLFGAIGAARKAAGLG